MKKLISMLIAIMLCTVALTACGGGSNSGSAASQEPASSPVAVPSASTGENNASQSAESTYRVAAIFGGSINDGSWYETQYVGLKSIQALGADISFVENISETDAPESARTYADEGYNLIYLTTNTYQDYCTPVAEDFPDTIFVQINGTVVTDNFISVQVSDAEQGFLQGALAALLTKTGKVGFVGGMEITPIINGAAGFRQGVDYVNSTYGLDVDVTLTHTGSFTDVNKAKETAISMIEGGADVVAPMADDASIGIMEAAEDKGAMAIGSGMGLEAYAPTATQIISVKDVGIVFSATYNEFINGTLATGEINTYGIESGVVYLSDWIADADAEIKAKAEEIEAGLLNGDITITLE